MFDVDAELPNAATQPKNNAAFWLEKLGKNQARDRLVTRTLRAKGWKVVRIWEHELTKKNQARLLRRLRRVLAAVAPKATLRHGARRRVAQERVVS